MRPCDTPDGAVVAFERFCEAVGVVFYFEDLDGAVGGGCCEASAVVVEDCVVLWWRSDVSAYVS
jgi:hypothetical protein